MGGFPTFRTLLVAAALGVSMVGAPAVSPATAQVLESDVDDLRYRVRQLERQFKSMKGRGGDSPSSLATRFQNRLNQMERSIQKLTSKVEDLAHRIGKIEKDRKSFKADVDYRLGLLEKKGGHGAKRSAERRAAYSSDRAPQGDRLCAGSAAPAVESSRQPETCGRSR